MNTIQKESDSKVKLKLIICIRLATNCCQFDSARYPLSAMKLNPRTDKNTQTIKDGSTPLKQASEKCGLALNLVVYNKTPLSRRELGFE
jgi:hypothetical protein